MTATRPTLDRPPGQARVDLLRARRSGSATSGGVTRRQRRAGLLFALPAMVLLVVIHVFPIFLELGFSLTRYSLLKRPVWIGLRNFAAVLSSATFWASMLRTAYFASVLIVVGMTLCLGIALLLNQTVVGATVHRIFVYLPQTVSYAAGAVIWTFLFNAQSGPIDRLLEHGGVGPIEWLTSTTLAMPSIIILSLWRDAGFYMLIFLAALQNVRPDLLEACRVDGASWWSSFRHVTVPSIRPALMFVLLTWSLGALQMFTQAYVMTSGGPANATRSVVMDIYTQGFEYLRLGYASAESFVVFVFSLALAIFYVRQFRRVIDE